MPGRFQSVRNRKDPSSFKPDQVSSVEVGAKSTLFNHRLQIAASAYQLNWRHIQQYVLLPGCGFQYTDNLGDARARGFELQMTIRPIRVCRSMRPLAIPMPIHYPWSPHGRARCDLSRPGDTLGSALCWKEPAALGIPVAVDRLVRTGIQATQGGHARPDCQHPRRWHSA